MSRALGLALGVLADRVGGDPARWHPVAGFGRAASALERHSHDDARPAGVVHVAVLVGAAYAAGRVLDRSTIGVAACTWAVLGGRSLDREAAAIEAHLEAGDLAAARRRLPSLVGRDPSGLDAGEIARAVVESVAENTSDAVVAPLFWGAVAGAPGLLAYRAANTLDAMIGHRNERYERFGWAAARLDDLLNLAPARLTGLLVVALGGHPRAARTAWRRDAPHHPSPNAGVVEAAFAGTLGLRLGGTNTYGDHVEHRATLGIGRATTYADIARARAIARRVQNATALLATTLGSAVASSR